MHRFAARGGGGLPLLVESFPSARCLVRFAVLPTTTVGRQDRLSEFSARCVCVGDAASHHRFQYYYEVGLGSFCGPFAVDPGSP